MILKRACFLGLVLVCALSMPLSAETQTEVGVVFMIESPQIFPDQTLGQSKSQIESEMSQLLAARLEFHFPFLEWKVGATSENQILFKLIERENGLCDWQTDLVVRALRSGNEIEMTDVPTTPLYDLCDPFIPNRKASGSDALKAEDQAALLEKLRQAVENFDPSADEPAGLLNNIAIRKAIHHDFLGTISMTQGFELIDQPDGSGKYLYLPINFADIQSSLNDTSCDELEDDCSLLRLTVQLPNSLPASFTLRVAGNCGDKVLCELLDGGVPGGFQIAERTYWDDGLENLLNQAQGLSFTMVGFRKNSSVCVFAEP